MLIKSLTRYLNSAATFAPPDDPVAAARAAVQMNEHDKEYAEETDDEAETPNENEEADDDNDTDDEQDSESEEEGDDDKEGKEDEETAEAKAARIAQEKEERKEARIQKRIDKAVAAEKAAKAEAETLRRQLAENPVEGLTEEEVERRAEAKAAEKAGKYQLDKDIREIAEAGSKIDKKFSEKVNAMASEAGVIPIPMIGILADLGYKEGGAVLNYLADNIEEYEEVLELTPTRMAAKLARISDKIKDDTKPKPKPRSNVPPPIRPVTEGNGRRNDILPKEPTKNIEDFVRIRNAQDEAKRKARGY